MVQFARYFKNGIKADDNEGVYMAAHAAIPVQPYRLQAVRTTGT